MSCLETAIVTGYSRVPLPPASMMPFNAGYLRVSTASRRIAGPLRLAAETLRPHFLSLYLYELAGDYSSFNSADKVLVDDPAVRARRLLLCARTLLVLETGLRLLGLRPLTRM